MAAENVGEACSPRVRTGPIRFNEAAAHGRGKLPGGRFSCGRRGHFRFNEAAAHGRGKRGLARRPSPPAGRFNEAAAHGRGKPTTTVDGLQNLIKLQ